MANQGLSQTAGTTVAVNDHPFGDRGQRGGAAPGERDAAAVLGNHGSSGTRRPRQRPRISQHHAGHVNSRDELGEMGESFNVLQDEGEASGLGLDRARENVCAARAELIETTAGFVHLAHHDSLPDLPNRIAFTQYLARSFEEASASGSSFAILCIDLDEFNEANDVFGYAVGDLLLRAVSDRLQ